MSLIAQRTPLLLPTQHASVSTIVPVHYSAIKYWAFVSLIAPFLLTIRSVEASEGVSISATLIITQITPELVSQPRVAPPVP